MITEKDVRHVAKLSKLEFTDEEIENFVKDMDSIVEYVNTLEKVDTSNVKEDDVKIKLSELRKDEVKNSLLQHDAILNAPKKQNGGFSVPQVVE